MRKILRGLLIGLLAFLFGVRAVGFVDSYTADPPGVYEVFVAPKGPRFSPTGRGCGNGYVQGYVTNDGQRVSEGMTGFDSRRLAREAVEEWKDEAVRILESSDRYKDHTGEVGQRVIFEYDNDATGKRSVVILFYDGSDGYRFFTAPTLELALEFEQYVINTNDQSPM